MNFLLSVLTLMLLVSLAVLVFRLRSHPQEWRQVLPSRQTVRRWAMWIGLPLACWAIVTALSHSKELTEAYERIQCGGDACPVLSAEELRWRFIKSYLHYMLDDRTQLSKARVQDQLVLLPLELNAQRLVKEIEDGTVLTTLTINALPLNTHEEIDALTSSLLVKHLSFAWVSLPHRRADVALMQSIQSIRLEDVNLDYTKRDPYEEVAKRIGRWERLRGYGKYFFEVNGGRYVDLACCDGMPIDVDRESLVERKKRNIEHLIKFQHDKSRSVLAASDRGNLLIFEDERAENSGTLTPTLFYTKSDSQESP